MMKLNKLGRKFLVPLLALMLTLPQAASAAADSTEQTKDSELEVLQEVLDYLDSYNIEGAQRQEFIDNAIRGMIYTLDDPYSDYLSPEDMEQFAGSINREYVGIGITLRYAKDNLYITSVLDGSPAKNTGLKQGDIITKINGVPVADMEDIDLSGQADTIIRITVKRGTNNLTFPVKRTEFSLNSVTGKLIPSSTIGYISIASFSEDADEEFTKVLSTLKSQGMKSMVLDLRDNLGGYVESAQNIASQFMKSGTLMYTADKSGKLEKVSITDGKDIGMPVIILTNEWTASASEILTGALHDNGIAKVIGAQTYGKARIQNVFQLSNGGYLKMTIERYLTPNKVDFNHIGLKPDIEITGSPVAQLITGLHKAGLKHVDLSGSAYSLKVNGVELNGYIDTVENGSKVYAPARVLAALIQGSTTWNKAAQKLVITDQSGKKTGFTLASKSIKMIDDESYVELHDFGQKFPNLKWSYGQGIIHLSY
jgi:carboxyl-terminal processing protease